MELNKYVLNVGNVGNIELIDNDLLDNEEDAIQLKKMSYDGRLPNIPWREQNIDTMGYHYYMTPETAQQGLDRLSNAINTEPRKWKYDDWPNLSEMKFFQK